MKNKSKNHRKKYRFKCRDYGKRENKIKEKERKVKKKEVAL